MLEPARIQTRSSKFAVRIVNLNKFLNSKSQCPYALANQLLRSGTSVGANVSEAQAAQSKKDFISKMSIAAKEARETEYWIKLLIATELVPESQLEELNNEIYQIIAILTKIIKTSQQSAS
jgi:four helix bundle protein